MPVVGASPPREELNPATHRSFTGGERSARPQPPSLSVERSKKVAFTAPREASRSQLTATNNTEATSSASTSLCLVPISLCSDLSTRRVTNLLRTDVRQLRLRSALFTRSDEGYFGMGYFQATIFTVISSLLAFNKLGCASAQRSGLAKTRTTGDCGRRFAAHRGIESVRISIIRRGRAKRSTPPPSRGTQLL